MASPVAAPYLLQMRQCIADFRAREEGDHPITLFKALLTIALPSPGTGKDSNRPFGSR